MTFRLILTLVLLPFWPSSEAKAADFAAQFSWPRPAYSSNKYIVEIARQPDFSKVTLRGKAVKAEYLWSKPNGGVWHWRVREEQKGDYFCHGSFVIISANEKTTSTPKSPHLQWSRAQADEKVAIQLHTMEAIKFIKHSKSNQTTLRLPNQSGQITITRVRKGKLATRTMDLSYWPNLKITDTSTTESAKLSSKDVLTSKGDTALSSTQSDAAAHKSPRGPVNTKIGTSILSTRHQLNGQKKEIDLDATLIGFGAKLFATHKLNNKVTMNGQLAFTRAEGMVPVSGAQEGNYFVEHEHTDIAVGASVKMLRSYPHELGIGLSGRYTLTSSLTEKFDASSASVPKLIVHPYYSGGTNLAYSYQYRKLKLKLKTGWDRSFDAAYSSLKHDLEINYLASQQFSFSIGLNYYRDELSRCHKNAETCNTEGEVSMTDTAITGSVGFGYHL